MKTKLITSFLLVAIFSGALFSFKNLEENLNQEDSYLLLETNNKSDVKRVDDLLTSADYAKVEKLAKMALLKIRITTKNRKEDKEIIVEGSTN